MDKEKTTRQRLAEWSKTPEGRESYEKVAEEMRREISEKPMNLDELMKEAQRYYSDNFEYLSSDQPTLSILTNIARYFAQWGANHTPLPEDTVLFNKGVAEGKRLMMEEAVEGEVVKDISNKLAVTAKINLDGFKFGDKVRVIVLPKEDEK